ncbi:hypothetical protein DW896_21230, partial [Bacteroides sp. AM41-16]
LNPVFCIYTKYFIVPYIDYIAGIKAQYPKLTDEDLLFLCLDEIGFSSQTISLCFGNIDTHALAQRKYRMKKERM